MLFRSVVLFFALVFGFTEELAATLIIAYRSHDEVIIAADSLRTIRTVPSGQTWVCKIRNFGDVVFASAGDTTLPGDGFSLDTIPLSLDPRTRPDPVSVPERIARFEAETIEAFTRLHGERTSTRFVSFSYVLGFLLDGRPVGLSRRFTSSDGMLVIGEPEELPAGQFLFAGQPSVLDSLPSAGFSDAQRLLNSVPLLLSRLIDYQASRSPTVGGPVDIIRLTVTGPEWLQRKSYCAERE